MAETADNIPSTILKSIHYCACLLFAYAEFLLTDKYNRRSAVAMGISLSLGQIKHLLDKTGGQPVDPLINLSCPVICEVL